MMNIYKKQKVKIEEKYLVATDEATKIAGVTRQTLSTRARAGEISHYYKGGKLFYDIRELEKYDKKQQPISPIPKP